MLKGDEAWLNEMFESIVQWTPKTHSNSRLVWIQIRGPPLDVWNQHCFVELAMTLGEVMMVDEKTEVLSKVDYARVLIKTSLLEVIHKIEKMLINGRQCVIKNNVRSILCGVPR